MPIPEQDALRAIAIAKANPNDPAVIAKAQALTRAYQAQQEAAGLSMFPEQERRRDEQASTLRSFFTEPNHGLDEDTLLSLNENFRESPDEKFKLFNRKWFEAAGVPRERVEREADELMKIYSEREWGTPSTTHKHFFDRIARDYQTREEVANAAKETSLQNLGVLRSELAFKERFRENSAYVGREQKWDKEFQSLKERFDQKLAPHRSTIKLLSAALMTKEGVGVEDPKTMDEAFAQRREIDNAPSYRELAEMVMMVPAEDRKLVIAAAVAASANDEAGRKSVMEGLVEKFDRGLRGGMDSVVSIGERSRAIDVKAAIAEGVEVPAEKAGTPEEYVEAVYQRVGLGDDYEIRTGVMRLVEGMKFAKPTDEVKGEALAMIQERMDAIDLRDELRLAAENDIDPVTSEFLPVRGLYATAESVPYMMISMVRGGWAINAMALAGDSYRSLRAANPTMTAEQAQGLSMLSGLFQAFIEKGQTTLALGQLKAVNRFFNQITRTKGAVASRFLTRTAATTGAEMIQENVQDVTPFVLQELLSALDEDMPGVPWELVFGDLLKQQPELFFAVLPLAVIGGGAGTYSDFKGGAELLTSYDLLRATGLSEAAASEVRALASRGNVEGAQALLRQEFKTLGQDQKSVQEARAEAIPRMIAEREAMQQALNEAGELDILPAILREGEKYTLRYTGGEAVQYDSHAEAFARFEAVASSAVAALHEDMITAARMTTSQIERGREVKFIVSPLRPTTEDMEAQGVATGEDMAQRMEISEADKALTPKTEERKAKAMAGMVANSPEARTAVNYILGSATTADAAPDSFGDRVVRNTVRLYQGATPFTLFEETAEGDAKFMIRELGLRRWMIGALRQWEATSGDTLFRASIKEESEIKDQDIVEAYSKMVQGYLAGRSKSGDQGRVFSSRFRKSIADALRGDFGAVLTGYASLFEAVYRRAAMIEKARRDKTFDGDLETFLAKSTGMSEQRLFERDVQREGSAIAQDLSGNPDFSSGEGTGATFSVMQQERDADPYKDRTGEQAGEPLTQTEISEGIEDESGTVADIEIDDDAFSDESVTTFSVVGTAPIITRASLKGKQKFVYFSDWTRVGTYTGLHNGSGISIPLQGGPMYPYIKKNAKAGAGWAFTTEGMFTRFQARVDATDGVGLTTLYGKDNLRANPTFLAAYVEELRYSLRSGLIEEGAMLERLNEARTQVLGLSQKRKDKVTGKVKTKFTVSRESDTFPLFSKEWEGIDDFRVAMESATFEVRAEMFSTKPKEVTKDKVKTKVPGQFSGGRLASQKSVKAGMPDVIAMIDLFADPQFDGGEYGLIIGAVQFEKSQSKPSRAEDIKADPHRSYPVVIKGKGIGLFDNPIHVTNVIKKKGKKPHEITRSAETSMAGVTFSVLKKNAKEIKAEVDAMSSDQIRAALEKATLTPTLQMVELLGEFPEYLEPVVDYIMGKRDALISGNVSVRDVAKAYWITVASIGADAIDVETIRRQADAIGIPFDPSPMFLSYGKKGQPQMRPEELAAWWLGTPEGQTALNNIEAGNFNQSDWETGLKLRDAFGRNDLNEKTTKKGSYVAGGVGSPKPNKFNLRNITDLTDQINASKGNPAKLEKALMSLNNIAEGKKGFIGHMLGFGEWATLDAVELNIWLTGRGSTTYQTESKKRIAAIAKKASGTKALSKDLFGRIRKRINALRKDAQGGMKIPEEVAAHIIHHWIWDKAKGIETTHQGVYHAMETFSVIRVSPENPVLDNIEGIPAAAIFQSAKKRHGVTRSIYEAGYVLPDGTMLDFSGRADAAGFKQLPNLTFVAKSGRDYMRDQRSIDHREIEWEGMPPAEEQWSSMVDFLRLGAIRVDANSGMISMHSRAKVTSAQASVLKDIVRSAGGAYIDLEDDVGNRASMSLDGDKFGKVNGFLTRWANGETPEYDGTTFSLLPDASNLDTEFARMFSPFQRSPELRAKLGMEMRRRVAEQVTKLRPILRANRTKASIEAERKRRQDEIFTEKLDTLSAGEIQALANENLLEDNSLTPILAELLREKTYLTKSGKRVRYWTGSLMSKSEANRRGYDTTGGEWDAVPEGLPPYVYGGSITPDEAATMFDFETPEAFFDALASEIQSRGDRKQEVEDAKRRVRELEKEARQEARAWADEAMKERKTVGGDRAVLLGFLRTLDAITRALPAEVRGKIGGSVALAKLVTPAAMLDEIESRVERIDVELERYLKKEATEQVKAFFEKVAKSRQTEAGKAAKGKRNLPEIYKVMTLAENAFKAMSAEEGQAEGAKLTGLVDSRAVPDDDVAATLMAAELIPLFSGWNGRTQDTVVNGKTTRVRIAEPSDSARKFAALEAAKRIWDGGLLEWKTRQAEIKERRDAVREEGLVDISKANKLRTRDEQAIRGMTRASLAKKIALNMMSVDGFFRWHLGENSKVYQWISDSERQAAFAYDTAVRNISKSVDDWFKDRAGSNLKGQKLRQTMAETYVELTPEKGEKRKLNQLQLITAALIWRQEDGRRHMRGRRDENGNIVSSWSYGDGFMKQVEEAMSEDAVELMQFLSDAYEAEYVPLNKVYRKLFGIDLPRHIFYAPLTVKPEQKNDASVDPLTGFFSGGLSGIAGALKTRGTSTVEPDFRDALQTFLAHSMQMEHFKAFAELAREAKAIFGRVSFQDQIGRASGEEGVTILNGILEQLDKGGVRSSHIHLEATTQLERVIGRLSTIILFGKLQTIALNITQIFAARAEMTGSQFRRQMGKLLFGKLDWIEGFKSPYIQNRVEQMPPVVAQAIQSGRKLGPSIWNEVNDKLGYGIAGSDGWWTAATYVMLYDFKKQEAAKLGMDSVAAEEFARNEAERITDRVAQPTRKGARSVFENNMSPEGRAFMNFFSESRKNLALLAFAFAKDRSKLSGTGQYVILNALIATMIRAAWQDFRDDDEGEDEVIWNPRKLALEIAIDPVYGIPIFGGVLQDTIKAAFGFKTFGGTLLESGQNVIPATRRMVTMDYNADEIDRIAADLNAILGAFGYFSKRAASLAALTNILEDALKVYDNLTQDTP